MHAKVDLFLKRGHPQKGRMINAPVPRTRSRFVRRLYPVLDPSVTKRYALERVDKVLANLGYCTRSSVPAFLRVHEVLSDGTRLDRVSTKVDARKSKLTVDGEALEFPQGILVSVNKPCGYVCTHSEAEGPVVYDLVPGRWTRRNPPLTSIGRLDKDTSGLVLLTTHTHLVHYLTRPANHVVKRYRVGLARTIEVGMQSDLVRVFGSGAITLRGEDLPCRPAKLAFRDPQTAVLDLSEGKYHQVRRMFAACGHLVVSLHREGIGKLSLGGLEAGDYRHVAIQDIL